MTTEDCGEWRECPLFPGQYVSSNGWVRLKHKVTLGSLSKTGYLTVKLGDKTVNVHRLIAAAFVKDFATDPERRFVNHRDGDRANNRAANLEMVSFLENTRDGTRRRRVRLPRERWPEVARRCLSEDAASIAADFGVTKVYVLAVMVKMASDAKKTLQEAAALGGSSFR